MPSSPETVSRLLSDGGLQDHREGEWCDGIGIRRGVIHAGLG
jgi:hypothetical protein